MIGELGDSYHSGGLAVSEGWTHVESSGHSVHFYGDDVLLVDGLSRFVGAALGAGDAAIVIATEQHRQNLVNCLGDRGFNVALAKVQRRLILLDARETLALFMRGSSPDPLLFNRAIGAVFQEAGIAQEKRDQRRTAVFGEMVALLWADGNRDAAIELEQLWNEIALKYDFDLRCAYPMHLFPDVTDGEFMAQVCSQHPHVYPTESYYSLPSEHERLRAIVELQQKAHALETQLEEYKRVQAQLAHRESELRDALAARNEFLSVAAHELKTPMTSLRGFAQLLLRDTKQQQQIPSERLASALSAIEMQTDRLTKLVSRLLDTSQIEAGKLRIEPVETDIARLVRSMISQHQMCTTCPILYVGPPFLYAEIDPIRIEQVVANLLDNAVKYGPDSGVIEVELTQLANGEIHLSVSDEGVGIPEEQREKIFGRFHQVHTSYHLSGMGLGLYISRQIAELHGGWIQVSATEAHGSRFVLSLPSRAVRTQERDALL